MCGILLNATFVIVVSAASTAKCYQLICISRAREATRPPFTCSQVSGDPQAKKLGHTKNYEHFDYDIRWICWLMGAW